MGPKKRGITLLFLLEFFIFGIQAQTQRLLTDHLDKSNQKGLLKLKNRRPMLNFYSASTGTVNSVRAMKECIENSLSGNDTPTSDQVNLLVLHSTIGHDFKQLLQTAKELCPNAAIVGCTCAGVIGREGANESMRALGIMLVHSDDPSEIRVASCENIRGENSFEMAKDMANQLGSDVNMVMILASGIDIAADKAIEGIEAAIEGDIPIFGGTSSDNMRAISSYQFSNSQVLERGAILVGFADPSLEIAMGVHHGSVPIGQPFQVTKSDKNRVYELDGKAAWPLLMDKLGMPQDSHPGPCIPVAGMGELLPDDLHEEYDNKHILRVIVKVDQADGSFYMPVDCPEGTDLWVTQRDEELIFNGLERMMGKMKDQIGERKLAAVFHTDCAARGRALFNKVLKDEIIARMQTPLVQSENIPWLGMYGFGEFTQLNGKNYFHNYTTSLYALVRK